MNDKSAKNYANTALVFSIVGLIFAGIGAFANILLAAVGAVLAMTGEARILKLKPNTQEDSSFIHIVRIISKTAVVIAVIGVLIRIALLVFIASDSQI